MGRVTENRFVPSGAKQNTQQAEVVLSWLEALGRRPIGQQVR